MHLWFSWEFIFMGANIMSHAEKMPDVLMSNRKNLVVMGGSLSAV